MFSGFDEDDRDMINLVQAEAITLVDSVLEESIVAVSSSKSIIDQTPSVRFESDEQLISFEMSNEESSIGQQNLQLHFNNNNAPCSSDNAQLSDLSDNFAIKCDYDVIMKSPTIESGMSGRDFDDDYNFNSSSLNNVYVSSYENSSNVNQNCPITHINNKSVVDVNEKNVLNEQEIHDEAKILVDSVIRDTIDHLDERSTDVVSQLSSSEIKEMLTYQGDESFRNKQNK